MWGCNRYPWGSKVHQSVSERGWNVPRVRLATADLPLRVLETFDILTGAWRGRLSISAGLAKLGFFLGDWTSNNKNFSVPVPHNQPSLQEAVTMATEWFRVLGGIPNFDRVHPELRVEIG
jgi:hypothetical protein